MPELQSEIILGEKWAARLCAVLLIGFAFVVAFAAFDRLRISGLEKADEQTAVGDAAFFKPPEKFDSSAVFVKLGGKPLYPTGTERYSLHDSKMLRVGTDDSKTFKIYKSAERGGKDGDFFFLKTADGQYLEMSRQQMAE